MNGQQLLPRLGRLQLQRTEASPRGCSSGASRKRRGAVARLCCPDGSPRLPSCDGDDGIRPTAPSLAGSGLPHAASLTDAIRLLLDLVNLLYEPALWRNLVSTEMAGSQVRSDGPWSEGGERRAPRQRGDGGFQAPTRCEPPLAARPTESC